VLLRLINMYAYIMERVHIFPLGIFRTINEADLTDIQAVIDGPGKNTVQCRVIDYAGLC
jgi:hypothetical protein